MPKINLSVRLVECYSEKRCPPPATEDIIKRALKRTLKMSHVMSVVATFAIAMGSVSPKAYAQEGEAAKPPAKSGKGVRVNKEHRLSLDFEDELVSGEKLNPEVETIFSRKNSNFKRMIKLRNNFIPEVKRGSGEFGSDKKK